MRPVCPPCQYGVLFFHIFSWQVHQLGEASPGPARYNVQGELAKYLGEVHQVEENGFGPKILGWEWLLRFVWYIYTYLTIAIYIYILIYIMNVRVDCWRYMITPPWGQHTPFWWNFVITTKWRFSQICPVNRYGLDQKIANVKATSAA